MDNEGNTPTKKRQRRKRGSKQIQCRIDAHGVRTYSARFTERGERKFVTLMAHDEEAAEIEFAEMKLRIKKGEPAIPAVIEQARAGGLTLRDLAKKFCGTKEGKWKDGEGGQDTKKPEKYRRQFWSVLKCHVLDALGDKLVNEVKRADIVCVVDAMRGEKRRTTQKAVRNLSKLYNWALDREYVTCENPARRQKTPKYKESNSYYRDDEVARLLVKAVEVMPDLYPVIAFAAYAAARKGECAALRWVDVDLEAGEADISRSWDSDARKSGEPVKAHFHERLTAILRAHYVQQAPEAPDALVFPDKDGKMRREFDDDLWGLDKLIELAEVRRFKRPWHSFRHWAGTALAASGASLPEVQQFLGQTTLEMARRYVKTANAQVKKRVRAMPTLGPEPAVADLTKARRDRQQIGTTGVTQAS